MSGSAKALWLNLGTAPVTQNPLIAAEAWAETEGHAAPIGPYVLGLDLSDGVRKTMVVCHRHEFRPFASLGAPPAIESAPGE